MGYLEVQHRRVISARWHQRVTMSGPCTELNRTLLNSLLTVILCRSMQNYAKGDKRVSASTFLHQQGNSELPTTAATPSGPSMRSQAIKTSNFQELGSLLASQFCQVAILDPNSLLAAIDPTLAPAGSHLLHHCQFLLTTSLQSLSRHLKKTVNRCLSGLAGLELDSANMAINLVSGSCNVT